jgi:hypothetical protein
LAAVLIVTVEVEEVEVRIAGGEDSLKMLAFEGILIRQEAMGVCVGLR